MEGAWNFHTKKLNEQGTNSYCNMLIQGDTGIICDGISPTLTSTAGTTSYGSVELPEVLTGASHVLSKYLLN